MQDAAAPAHAAHAAVTAAAAAAPTAAAAAEASRFCSAALLGEANLDVNVVQLGEPVAGATAAAAAAAATHNSPNTQTVNEVVQQHRSTLALGPALARWVQACGIASYPGSVPVIKLLPHYRGLLAQLDILHSSSNLGPKTVYRYLLALSLLVNKYRQDWQSSCEVDYEAMLYSLAAARRKYSRLSKQRDRANTRKSKYPDTTAAKLGAASGWTVDKAGSNRHLQGALKQWVQACGIAGDPGSVCVVDLLPHYAKALCLLEDLHSSTQMTAGAVFDHLQALCFFLTDHRQDLQDSLHGADYAAMLSSMHAANSIYYQLCNNNPYHQQNASCTRHSRATGCTDAATDPFVATPMATEGAAPTAAAAAAAAGGAAADEMGAPSAAMAMVCAVSSSTSSDILVDSWDAAPAVRWHDVSSGHSQAAAAGVAGGQACLDASGMLQQQQAGLISVQQQQQWQEQQQQPACSWEVAAIGWQPEQPAAAAAAASTAILAQLQTASPSTLTVKEAAATSQHPLLLSALRKWVQACGIASDPDSVRVAELLPHYACLLALLDNLHSRRRLGASTVVYYLSALRVFLSSQHHVLQEGGSVDYAAMLIDFNAAYDKHLQMSEEQWREGSPAGSQQEAAASVPALIAAATGGPDACQHRSCPDTAPAAAAGLEGSALLTPTQAVCVAAAGTADGASLPRPNWLLGGLFTESSSGSPLGERGPAAAATVVNTAEGCCAAQQQAAAAAAGGGDDVILISDDDDDEAAAACTGRDISMAHLLQQLQLHTSSGFNRGAGCIRQLQDSAACFESVSLEAIPASLLLTNYIAELGDRAQQCLSAGAVGKRGAAGAGGRKLHNSQAECLAVMREVEGLLQLSVQPVLQQVLGGQRLQELVEGLMRCKQLLGKTFMRLLPAESVRLFGINVGS